MDKKVTLNAILAVNELLRPNGYKMYVQFKRLSINE